MAPGPVLFPGVPGGVELLVVLLVALFLLGLPLLLLLVGGAGFWRLSREDDDHGGGDGGENVDDETVAELRERVDELEAQLADSGGASDDDRSPGRPDAGPGAGSSSDPAPDAGSTDHDDGRERRGDR